MGLACVLFPAPHLVPRALPGVIPAECRTLSTASCAPTSPPKPKKNVYVLGYFASTYVGADFAVSGSADRGVSVIPSGQLFGDRTVS